MAYVPEEKLVRYLLNRESPEGWSKAGFLYRFGLCARSRPVLEEAPLGHVLEVEILGQPVSPYREKYGVEGPLEAPDGRRSRVVTV